MVPLSICIIAKNEEKNIEKCVSALQRSLQDSDMQYELAVTDTGSMDKTIETAQNLGCRILHYEWKDDFAAARNFAASQAAYDTILFIDADEFLENGDWRQLQQLMAGYPDAIGCIIRRNLCISGDGTTILTDNVPRLYRRDRYHYEGSIHEQLLSLDRTGETAYQLPLTFYHEGYMGTPEERMAKAQRNNRLLFQELEKHPDDAYLYFQIAQSYSLTNQVEKEYEYYVKAYSLKPDKKWDYCKDLVTSLGHIMLALDKTEEALQLLAEEYDSFRHYADFLCMGGKIYIQLGMLIEAIQIFEEALAAQNFSIEGMNSTIPHYHLGCIYEAFQNEALALYHFRLADGLGDSWERTQDILERCPTDEELYCKKVSILLAVDETANDLSSVLASLEKQTIGISHLEIMLVLPEGSGIPQNVLKQAADFEKANERSVVLIALPEKKDILEMYDIALSYAGTEYIYYMGGHDVLHPDAMRILRLELLQTDSDFAATGVSFNDTEYFTVEVANEQTASELIQSGLLGHPFLNHMFQHAFLRANHFSAADLLQNKAVCAASQIFCIRDALYDRQ